MPDRDGEPFLLLSKSTPAGHYGYLVGWAGGSVWTSYKAGILLLNLGGR